MSLERIGKSFYSVAGECVVDRVPVGTIAEMCIYAALRQCLDGELESGNINDLIQDEWPGSRLPDKDLAAIRPAYKRTLKKVIAALQALEAEVVPG
ncbi:hypothetical protein [Methanomethylovorans sp.]|uniref:hypothetical protein n=1 Tax=Methanomethylovorans sp. TaxID=2758717 RepID=UPI002FDE9CD8